MTFAHADLYKFAIASKTWETLNGIEGIQFMPVRIFPAMIAGCDGSFYVLGGYNLQIALLNDENLPHLDDFFKFDPQTQTLERLSLGGTSPGPRWGGCLFARDKFTSHGVGDDSLYLHGGTTSIGNLRIKSPLTLTLLASIIKRSIKN